MFTARHITGNADGSAMVMKATTRKRIVGMLSGVVIPGVIFMILLLHEAWGDQRYVLKEDARVQAIAELDAQLAIKDTEILFAENEREKAKLIAIKAIYERQKEALREKKET